MLIREYCPETDFGGLRECVIELQDYEFRIDSRFPDGQSIVDVYIPDVLERCRTYDGKILVAEVDGEVAGYVMVWNRYRTGDVEDGDFVCGLVADLAVLERYRGRGIGSALIRAAEDHARTHGVKYLRIGVMAGNQLARGLYESHGFAEVGIEMEKSLERST